MYISVTWYRNVEFKLVESAIYCSSYVARPQALWSAVGVSGHCEIMPTAREYVCCQDGQRVTSSINTGDPEPACIAEHEGLPSRS